MSKPSSPASALRIDVERRGDAAVVKLIGSANMDAVENLQQRLIEIVDTPTAQLVIDLSQLRFISSVGLGAIVAAHVRCRHYQGEVRLVAPPPKILELLQVTRLTRLFGIYDSVDAALASE